jgi:hypothetical protein
MQLKGVVGDIFELKESSKYINQIYRKESFVDKQRTWSSLFSSSPLLFFSWSGTKHHPDWESTVILGWNFGEETNNNIKEWEKQSIWIEICVGNNNIINSENNTMHWRIGNDLPQLTIEILDWKLLKRLKGRRGVDKSLGVLDH